jgi:hypothetical protein
MSSIIDGPLKIYVAHSTSSSALILDFSTSELQPGGQPHILRLSLADSRHIKQRR